MKLMTIFTKKCVFGPKVIRERITDDSMGHSLYTDLILTTPPAPPVLSLPVSSILFTPTSVKALSLPPFNKMPVHFSWGFHVSPNTERLGPKKGPPKRNAFCVLIHSAGQDVSKQHAFTTLATLFTSHWQTIGVNTDTHTHTNQSS